MSDIEKGNNPFLREKRGSRIIVSKKEERTEDGITFASKWELRVYKWIRDTYGMEHVQLQPKFELLAPFRDTLGVKHRGVYYVADFLIGTPRIKPIDPVPPNTVIIDAKGMKDAVFKIKNKWFLSLYKVPLELPAKVRDLTTLTEIINETVNIKPKDSNPKRTTPRARAAKKCTDNGV